MRKKLLPEAEQYVKRNTRRRGWRKVVQAMACVVVFCTTYALILPAITMEKECALVEHTHDENCYAQVTVREERKLECSYERLGVHVHEEGCYNAENELICAMADYVVHEHNESCWDEAGSLVCALPEVKVHEHTREECWQEIEGTSEHVHEEGCYQTERGELLCQIPEEEGHTHGENCYALSEEPVCGLEETEGHAHGEACTQRTLVCGESTEEVHSHESSCYEAQLICGETEAESYTYEEEYEETVLICENEAEDHEHGDSCYHTEVTVETVTVEGHSHSDSCYEEVLVCEKSTEAHVHGDGCYEVSYTCGLVATEGHSHSRDCYDSTIICEKEEKAGHVHGDDCYEQVTTLICEAEKETEPEYELVCEEEEILLHSHEDACYEITTDENGEEQKNLICPRTVVEEHVHGDTCFVTEQIPVDTETLTCTEAEAHVHGEGCYDEAGELTCTESTEGHVHSAMCYGTWELVCGLEEHVHDAICSPILGLSEENRAQVEYVIALIDGMPSADEIDAKIVEFEEAEDYEGEEEWLTEVYQQVARVYAAYSALGEELQGYVTNADKLMELEYIWSMTTLAVTTARPTIYQINSYDRSDGDFDGDSPYAVMLHGSGTVQDILGVPDSWIFKDWYAVFVEPVTENGRTYYKVSKIIAPGSNLLGYNPPENGYLLLFYNGQVIPSASVGNYVTIHFTVPASGAEKTEGYGTVSFSTAKSGIYSDAPTKINSTSTRDFVELNLYDYNGKINTEYWSVNDWYPGFQWNGGAYSKTTLRESYASADLGVPNYITKRNFVDSIDFGNSLITNLTYGGGASGDYTKAVNATNVVKTSDYYGETGGLNWIYHDSTGYTNRPIGTSTTDENYYDVMMDTLVSGYPALYDGTMLDYLFKPSNAVTKLNTESIDGLFQVNPVSGLYSFNSRTNHAEYVAGENRFQLYDDIITPNFITYPFGNFLPLNTIDDPSKATQISAFNYGGGMRNYVERIIADLKNDAEGLGTYWNGTQRQLAAMLEEYQESWMYKPRTINEISNNWENLSPANAIRDYFWGDTDGAGDKPSSDTSFITPEFLSRIYNIDWDVQTNFFFGMEMKMNVMMPKDGLTGKDNGNNSASWTTTDDGTFIRTGSPDGIPDYPMVFNFTGDDDVWVYIDDVLFLDLSGIHRHVGGTIDFQTGTVYYFELDPASGDTHQHDPGTTDYYKKYSFEEVLTAAGKDVSVLNTKGTFKDYTTHTFNFYYMERGSGSSVCRINFNFPMLRKNSINVTKENTDLSGGMLGDTVLGNPDYYFNIIQGDSLFVGPDSVTGIDEYLVMNSDGSYVKDENGADKVFKTDQYGIFSIKAGQTAIFEGINENSGAYYVQELIKSEDNAQYPTVYVNDVVTRYNDIIKWTNRTYFSGTSAFDAANPTIGPYGYEWYGRSGQDTDSSTQASFYFEQQNRVDTSKLAKLSISKYLNADITNPAVDTVYKMHVELDGEPLAVGTPYTIGENAYTVAETGIIPIKAGETATIGNIISGTRFEVWEDSGSAAGYFVSYDSENAEEERNGTSASGIIRVNTEVSVAVTNSENAAQVEIPVTKQLSNGACEPDTEHTYSFTLTQTDGNGNDLTGDDAYTQTLTIPVTGTAVGTGKFTLTYSSADYSAETSFPQTCYYRITENGGMENTITDDAVYQAVVTVNRDGNGKISAELTSLTLKGNSVGSADFVNTLTSSLSLKKLVDGSASAQENETFNFTLKFTYNDAPLTGSYPAVAHNKDGTTVDLTANLKEDGSVVFNAFYHGEYLVISGLPLGTKWEITETDVKNYIASWKVNEAAGNNTGNNTANGEITAGGTSVIFTNTTTYVLPETGSAGITPYTMAGLVLMIFSMAYLMYRPKARRREEFESP